MGNGSFPFRQRYTLGLCVCVCEGRKAVIACQSFPGGSFFEKASRVVVKLKKRGTRPSLFALTKLPDEYGRICSSATFLIAYTDRTETDS